MMTRAKVMMDEWFLRIKSDNDMKTTSKTSHAANQQLPTPTTQLVMT